LNQYMTLMVDCIDRTGGVVDKFIGDAIMAVWGIPVSKGNDVENAINGAILMRQALQVFNRGRGSEKKPIIHFGCGINAGPLLAGQIGSENRMEYTVIGDTVNLASRVEALNKPFGTDILIAEETYERVRETFRVEKMQPIRVKGKEKPQQIYAVLGREDDPECPRSVAQLRTMIGLKTMEAEKETDESIEEEKKYEIIQS
ncbi:MAG TPA: adenylate/guanylate cyclase domain-containing protein, partial [Spirochaetes bacterium]|nr:adenylate/guanylate cyclase domain-containing protein [Spirochaetota bacterium]